MEPIKICKGAEVVFTFEPGEKVLGMTTYADHVIVATDRGILMKPPGGQVRRVTPTELPPGAAGMMAQHLEVLALARETVAKTSQDP